MRYRQWIVFTFGHTAIRITDPDNFIDVVFNYGAFDFNTPNFVPKFAKGDLEYFAVAHSYTDFINEYTMKRSVYEQELLINDSAKQRLFDNLILRSPQVKAIIPTNLLIKMYLDGCSYHQQNTRKYCNL
jgi:hypothetical protein